MQFFNQYSFVVTLIFLLIVFALILWRIKRIDLPIRIGILVGCFVTGIFFASSRQYPVLSETPTQAVEIEQTIANGQPTFVMLYSNY